MGLRGQGFAADRLLSSSAILESECPWFTLVWNWLGFEVACFFMKAENLGPE
jgi:hypothetical protein